MNLKFRLAYRYLKGKNKYFFSFTNVIALLGIIIGLFSLIVVSSVMNGLANDMTDRIVATKGEVRILNKDFSPIVDYEKILVNVHQKYPEITVAGPVIKDDMLIKKKHNNVYTEIYGIDFEKHSEISNIFKMVRLGYPTKQSFKNNGIIIGYDIAWDLVATVGDTIDVISPNMMIPTPWGLIPKTEKFKIVGVFSTGLPEFDRLYSFIDIDKAKSFKKNQGADYLEAKINYKNRNYEKLCQQIEKDNPSLKAEHWGIFDKTLFQAIKVEQIAMATVMAIIIVLASFNITGNFIRTVTEKKAEIATLLTIGLNKIEIFYLFVFMGMIVCCIGVVLANLIAFILLLVQIKYQIFQIPIPGFPFTAIPVDLNLLSFFKFSVLTLIICLLGTLYPAYKTMKIDIIDVLHEEQQQQ